MRPLTVSAEVTPDQGEQKTLPSRFGEPLQAIHAGVDRLVEQLTPLLYAEEVEELNQVLAAPRAERCRVAVLGQVKAGKSSLVNALVRRHHLSPVNINPWTAVVCHLNFGGPIDPAARAVFSFFDEDDWTYLGSGGRMRELSERLGVSVDQELLRTHLENTRMRAEQRLGRQFHHLLGKQHRFAEPSAELLARYVSLGAIEEDDEDRRKPKAGRFSDITKSAKLFFDQAPFAYPTTIIDTPGTNDPLLFRDDLTQVAIDGADVYIVVLTAEQAFSTDDVTMLRMLHGLHKERLVVFINRIDVLDDIVDNVPRVVDHVRAQLAIEFPETHIPVVAGSALWAELALTWSEGRSTDDLPAALCAWASDCGMPPIQSDAVASARSEIRPRATTADRIMATAGITALEEILRDVIYDGPSMLGLTRGVVKVRSLHDDVLTRLRNECTTLEQALALAAAQQAEAEATLQELQRLETLGARLDAIEEPLKQDIDIIRSASAKRMKTSLEEVVTQFADEETESLRAAHRVSRVRRIWRCDTRPLRRRLEQTFLTTYDLAANELLEVEGDAWTRLEDLLNELLADQKIKFKQRPPHTADPSPSISGLGTTVALDLGDQWERWWHRWQSTARRARRFKELVHSEFSPIVAVLLVAAQSELSEQGRASMQYFETAKQQILKLLGERRERLERVHGNLDSLDSSETAELVAGYRSRRQAAMAELARCDAIEAGIEKLARLHDEGLDEAEIVEA